MGYSWVIPDRLAQGSRPDRSTEPLPFDVVVLAAMEIQPRALPGNPEILRVPLDDAKPTAEEIRLAILAARKVSRRLRADKRVLVTCHMGLNRSGLVTGLTLIELGATADQAVRAVRRARGSLALSNPHFVEVLRMQSRLLHGRSRAA
jgi:protein-tyrosine phosphatase